MFTAFDFNTAFPNVINIQNIANIEIADLGTIWEATTQNCEKFVKFFKFGN